VSESAPTKPIDFRRRAAPDVKLTFYETNVARARPLLRFLRSELDTLTFAKQLEDCPSDGAAVKEVFDPAFVADKPETLVDQKPCDRAGRHTRVLRMCPTAYWKAV
jgi:hypothetical protein